MLNSCPGRTFSTDAWPCAAACESLAAEQLKGIATCCSQPLEGYQATVKAGLLLMAAMHCMFQSHTLTAALQVDLAALRACDKKRSSDAIRALSCLRLALAGHELRWAVRCCAQHPH